MRRYLFISPFLIITIGLLIYALFCLFTDIFYPESQGWGFLLFFIYFGIAICVVLVDFLLKRIVRSRKLIIITQLVVLAFIGINSLLSDVRQTLQMPADFDQTYVTMIFDVEDEKKLSPRFMPFQTPIQVNKVGYVLTASTLPRFSFGNQKFKLKDDNGIEIGSDESDYDFITFQVYTVRYKGKDYNYLTYKIQPKKDCCGWGAKEVNEHHKEVEEYLKTYLQSKLK